MRANPPTESEKNHTSVGHINQVIEVFLGEKSWITISSGADREVR